ncbi:MAG: RNA methyltransferase [Paludibacter sp.]|jgi:TrmH family RNA methyltransferase|nr:RNA methyltransferase [Paludibacter sp.]
MLSAARIKFIRSLQLKKFRDSNGMFIAEGTKLIADLLGNFEPYCIYATAECFEKINFNADIEIVSNAELQRISNLKNPQGIVAVFKIPQYNFTQSEISNSLSLALDDIQDPGNLGTIVRTADWFGIRNIFCSPHSADIWNTKSVQATMGALARVKVYYVDLREFLSEIGNNTAIYGTFLHGENIFTEKLSTTGIIVIGNEGNGISPEIETLVSRRLTIPNFPLDSSSSESLNAAVAAAIVCAEFRRER